MDSNSLINRFFVYLTLYFSVHFPQKKKKKKKKKKKNTRRPGTVPIPHSAAVKLRMTYVRSTRTRASDSTCSAFTPTKQKAHAHKYGLVYETTRDLSTAKSMASFLSSLSRSEIWHSWCSLCLTRRTIAIVKGSCPRKIGTDLC